MPRSFLPARRSTRLLLLLCVCSAAVLLFRFLSGTGGRPAMPMQAQPVRIAEAVIESVPHYLNGLGTVTPSAHVIVRSRVDGHLLRLHFEDGQTVQAGDLLAEIDPRPFVAALNEAKGKLAKDQALLDNARRDLTRYTRLAKEDFIAGQEVDTQRSAVQQYEGTVLSDKAEVDAAALQLEYSRITAPISGRLGLRNVDTGNMIRSSDADGLVTITQSAPSDVIFTLPESQIPLLAPALREGRTLPVQAWDRQQQTLLAEGYLLTVDNRIDSSTGTVRLKARFENSDFSLFPNQFVNIRLLVRTMDNAITVPGTAIQLGAKGSFVYVVDAQNRVHARPVQTDLATDSLTVIREGLTAGEWVVTDGLDTLREGSLVQPVNRDTSRQTTATTTQDSDTPPPAALSRQPVSPSPGSSSAVQSSSGRTRP